MTDDYDDYNDYDRDPDDDYDRRDDAYDDYNRQDDAYDDYDRQDDAYDGDNRPRDDGDGYIEDGRKYSEEGKEWIGEGGAVETREEERVGESILSEEWPEAWHPDPEPCDHLLLLIKPEVEVHEHAITRRVCEEGFLVLQRRRVALSEEQASELYGQLYGDPGFPRLVVHLSQSGPVVALSLVREEAICRMNTLLGPEDVKEARRLYPHCLRAKYGNPRVKLLNALDSSQTPERAEFEIHFFFPAMVLRPLWTGQRAALFLQEFVLPTLLDGLVDIARVKPVDPVLHLAHWLLLNDPNKPSTNETLALIPT